jgi:hypothetical protein
MLSCNDESSMKDAVASGAETEDDDDDDVDDGRGGNESTARSRSGS